MGCNCCRSACEDCSEGGITFRRAALRAVAEMLPTASGSREGGRDAAEMGSDPDSAARTFVGAQSITESGSDPILADHRDVTSYEFLASIAYRESAESYLNRIDPQSDPIDWQFAETRRMGVRAQFGDTSPANPTPVGRIGKTPSPGIRPPFSCTAPEVEATA